MIGAPPSLRLTPTPVDSISELLENSEAIPKLHPIDGDDYVNETKGCGSSSSSTYCYLNQPSNKTFINYQRSK